MDAVVAAQAAHWFDLTLWYDEVRRVARPHAVIALVSYGIPDIDDDIDPIVSRFQQGTLRPHWPPERLHVDAGYRTLPFPFESVVAPELEIRLDWCASQFLGYAETWSAVRALEKAAGSAELVRFQERLEDAWGPGERTVRWPVAIVAGRV